MDVIYDFSDVEDVLSDMQDELEREMSSVGEQAVQYAREHGNYRNITGNLRRSNKYKVDESGLTIYNDADYASNVEQRGYDVISGAALFAEQRLKEGL